VGQVPYSDWWIKGDLSESPLGEAFIGNKRMDSQNTIFIDDSPEKCVCNDSGNCLFLETWNPLDASDNFLLCSLALWLLNVHKNCGRG
jgi:hypothetical protein